MPGVLAGVDDVGIIVLAVVMQVRRGGAGEGPGGGLLPRAPAPTRIQVSSRQPGGRTIPCTAGYVS